jgi:hypothetical protein
MFELEEKDRMFRVGKGAQHGHGLDQMVIASDELSSH